MRTAYPDPMNDTEVLYNDTCPVCRFEIDAYARRTKADGLPIRFDPLQRAEDWGLTPDQAARALHVRQGGVVLSGLPAFRALWAAMPRWRWLATVTGWPVVRPVLTAFYDRVMAPLLYQMHLRRQRRGR
ncbi:MAG: thiol-disulfide oxidoreductase DCC family protein [Paracoccaceae bacterium]